MSDELNILATGWQGDTVGENAYFLDMGDTLVVDDGFRYGVDASEDVSDVVDEYYLCRGRSNTVPDSDSYVPDDCPCLANELYDEDVPVSDGEDPVLLWFAGDRSVNDLGSSLSGR